MATLAIVGMLSAVIPAIAQCRNQRLDPHEIGIVPLIFAGQQSMERMMKIIAPLGVHIVAAALGVMQNSCIVQVAFGN